MVCAGADKPLVALLLLQALAAERTIVFTASVESTQRLFRLLEALPGVAPPAAAFSSAEGPLARAAALAAFKVRRSLVVGPASPLLCNFLVVRVALLSAPVCQGCLSWALLPALSADEAWACEPCPQCQGKRNALSSFRARWLGQSLWKEGAEPKLT